MKSYLLPIAVLMAMLSTATSGFAQLNLNGINMTNSNFGYFDKSDINVACSSPVTLGIGTNGSYELLSGERIRMCPGFTVTSAPGSTGYFQAHVANQLLEAEVLEPLVLDDVQQYEKVEIGIHLPQLSTRINQFINDHTGDYKPATATYNAANAAGTMLNPYDPEHITVEAFFFPPSSPNASAIIKPGFYYKKYNVGTHNDITDWTLDVTNPYEWRVRFTPEELGEWNVCVMVKVNNVRLDENFVFSFTVVEGTNPGFVNVAHNDQYLQYDNGEQYFPIGDNFSGMAYQLGDCHLANCTCIGDQRILPKCRQEFSDYLDDLSNANNGGGGGNLTRLILAPWELEFEWDRLGNYDSRQIEMGELDHFFEMAEERNVGLMLASLLHVEVDTTADGWSMNNYWQSSPYNANSSPYDPLNAPNKKYKGIDGLTDHLDFFTNSTAKKLYKNKLRYLSSRWGYSTSFLFHELLTEVDNVKQYWSNGTAHNADVEAWIEEMASYLKNELGGRQLMTASYLGESYRSEDGDNHVTTLWSKPDIDVICGHSYLTRLDGLRLKSGYTNHILSQFHKPALFNESDYFSYFGVNACDATGLHNALWAGAFSGEFGAGFSWDIRRYTIADWHDADGMQLEKEYIGLRNFFSQIDLLNYNYTPYNSAKVPLGATGALIYPSACENFYIARSDQNEAYGWVHNRSYNLYTHTGDCAYIDPYFSDDLYSQPYETMNDIVYHNTYKAFNTPYATFDASLKDSWDLSFNEAGYSSLFPVVSDPDHPYIPYAQLQSIFYVSGLLSNTNYEIEYYRTDGTSAGQHDPSFDYVFTTDNYGGKKIINGPQTGIHYPPDWAYTIKRSYQKADFAEREEQEALAFSVYPNPSSGVFTLMADPFTTIEAVTVIDAYGKQVLALNASDLQRVGMSFDLTGSAKGLYYVNVVIDGKSVTRKIVKN